MAKIEITDVSDAIMENLVKTAKQATCKRSKCGSIIITKDGDIVGFGYNSMPCNDIGECKKDGLPADFKSDKTCCIHAEQRAIITALKQGYDLIGSTLYFIRLDENDKPKMSGEPYCTICSKMALDVGIDRFVLWKKEGWTSYETKYYNELSFQYKG